MHKQSVTCLHLRIQLLSVTLGDLYKEFNTLKEDLAKLMAKFDGVETFVEGMRSTGKSVLPPGGKMMAKDVGARPQGIRRRVVVRRIRGPAISEKDDLMKLWHGTVQSYFQFKTNIFLYPLILIIGYFLGAIFSFFLSKVKWTMILSNPCWIHEWLCWIIFVDISIYLYFWQYLGWPQSTDSDLQWKK